MMGQTEGKEDIVFLDAVLFPFMPVSATNLFIKEEVFTVFRKRVKEI